MATIDPMAAVHQYINAFNKGDGEAMAATFAVPGSILDGMAPHVWQGPTASQDWYRDVLIEGQQHGVSDYFVTLGELLHNDVIATARMWLFPHHDVQSTRPTGYANRRDLYGGPLQARRRVAHKGLGVGERKSRVTCEKHHLCVLGRWAWLAPNLYASGVMIRGRDRFVGRTGSIPD